MAGQVTNAVLWVRKWVERMPTTTSKHKIWGYEITHRPYKCLKCGEILQDTHVAYDHLQIKHNKILNDGQWRALRSMRAKRGG